LPADEHAAQQKITLGSANGSSTMRPLKRRRFFGRGHGAQHHGEATASSPVAGIGIGSVSHHKIVSSMIPAGDEPRA